jgi:hypothetical protein
MTLKIIRQLIEYSRLRYKLQGALLGALSGYSRNIGDFDVKFNGNDLALFDIDNDAKRQLVKDLIESSNYIPEPYMELIYEAVMNKDDASIYTNMMAFFQYLIYNRVFDQRRDYTDFQKRYIPQNIVFYHVMCELVDHHYMSNFNATQFLTKVISRISNDEMLTSDDKIEQEKSCVIFKIIF